MKSLLIATVLGFAVLALAACAGPETKSTAAYTLSVNVVPSYSGGVVAQEPEPDSQAQYPDGTVVTLTAGPSLRHECKDTPYWAFIGWSADATGSTPTAEIIVDSEKSVTAGFKEFFPPKCPPVVTLKDPGGPGSEYAFDTSELNFGVGETVTLVLTSETQFHTFTVEALGIDIDVDGGTSETLTFIFDQPGTFQLICVPHEALGMTGTITVKPTPQ